MADLLPKNSTTLEKNLSATTDFSGIDVPIRDVWNPDKCPLKLLPWLAWAFSVDEWDTSWTEQQKRDAIKASYSVHRHKGTIGAVKSALAALGFSVRVQEWFNQIPVNEPYTYRLLLDVNQSGVNVEQLQKIQDVAETAKNLRSRMTTLGITVSSNSTICIGAVTLSGNDIAFAAPAGALILDGSWTLDGSEILDGLRI